MASPGSYVCVLLCASIDSQLEVEIAGSGDPQNQALVGLPKALLPIYDSDSMLDHWWDKITRERRITDVYIVTNALKYKYFERWATGHGLPVKNIINDGITDHESRMGASRDLALALKNAMRSIPDIMSRHLLVLAAENVFYPDFNISDCLSFQERKGGSLLVTYKLGDMERASTRGMVEVDDLTSAVLSFREKPIDERVGDEVRGSDLSQSLACPLFYILCPRSLALLRKFVAAYVMAPVDQLGLGNFLEFAVPQLQACALAIEPRDTVSRDVGADAPCLIDGLQSSPGVYAMMLPLPGASRLIGGAGLEEYRAVNASWTKSANLRDHITVRRYARVGLVGNPSDGFGGKTIAVTVANFWADVTLWPSKFLKLVPHPLYDPAQFGSLGDLYRVGRREGYQGGMRLLMATCKKFYEYCSVHGIALPQRNFTIQYDTNIPRQVGLAGSSAIVSALFLALMKFHGLSSANIALEIVPNVVLSVETEELEINAGLQDRVVQVFGGLMYMDFEPEGMRGRGHGLYERLPLHTLPPLFLVYLPEPSDSGKIHSTVKQRWLAGDTEVVEGMKTFAHLTEQGRAALLEGRFEDFGKLMSQNFDTRRRLYGDAVIGAHMIKMIEIARSLGAFAKFPGSGGAVVGMCLSESDFIGLREAYEMEGYVFTRLRPHYDNDNVL